MLLFSQLFLAAVLVCCRRTWRAAPLELARSPAIVADAVAWTKAAAILT
jgi:hypothetical protein